MTPAEKKRLTWLLVAIFFFFANLTLAAFFLIRGFPPSHQVPRPAQTAPAAQQ